MTSPGILWSFHDLVTTLCVRVEAYKCRAGHFLFCLMLMRVGLLLVHALKLSASKLPFPVPAKIKISASVALSHLLFLLRRIYFQFLWKWSFTIPSIFRRIFRKLNCCIRSIKVHTKCTLLLCVSSVSQLSGSIIKEPGIIVIRRLIRIVRNTAHSLLCQCCDTSSFPHEYRRQWLYFYGAN